MSYSDHTYIYLPRASCTVHSDALVGSVQGKGMTEEPCFVMEPRPYGERWFVVVSANDLHMSQSGDPREIQR